MKRICKVMVGGTAVVILPLLLLFASGGQARAQEVESGNGEDYCVLQVGDLNGDGGNDLVVSPKNPSGGLAVAYVFLSGGETLPDSFDRGYLDRNASYALKGSAAAPFACLPPLARAASTLGTLSRNRLTAAEQPATLQALSSAETGSPIDQPTRYTIVDLNTSGSLTDIMVKGINSSGQIAGQGRAPNGESHAFFHDGSGFHDLGTLGGHSSVACSINDAGEIVGHSLTGDTDESGFVESAFRSDGFSIWSLGRIWSHAFKINERGQVAGDMRTDSDSFHAALFENGGEKDLGILDGTNSFAFSLNESGHVVGEADTFIVGTVHPSTRAFVYKNGSLHDLGAFGHFCTRPYQGSDLEICFERSSATDINDEEQIAGFSSTENQGYQHAFLITGEEMEDLGTLGGNQSWAQAVNGSGQVVGSSLTAGDAAYHAFLFDQGTMYDLNDLVIDPPAGFSLWEALDINDFGQIVGLNYLLNPEYAQILPGDKYAFSAGFGKKLNFDFWIGESGSECAAAWAFARMEIRISGVDLNGMKNQSSLRNYLNKWLPASRFVRICGAVGEWQQGTLALPVSLGGRQADIEIRFRTYGGADNLPVYLRHFTMK